MISQLLALKSLEDQYPLNQQDPSQNFDGRNDIHTSSSHSSSSSRDEGMILSDNSYSDWAKNTIGTLIEVREKLWNKVLKSLGTIKTTGAFYFLVPIPTFVSEDEAIDILAKSYGVLLMHGTPFGAPNHLRLSYGSIPPQQVRIYIMIVCLSIDIVEHEHINIII